LIAAYNANSASLAYLTSNGPVNFSVKPNPEATFPFTSNCAPEPPHSYVAVFANLRVFADAQLTQKLCDLEAGATVPYDESKIFGAALKTQGSTGYVYEIFLNAFGARCAGATEGYINVQPVSALGAQRILLPITIIEAEK
jgi:hypothetical protein